MVQPAYDSEYSERLWSPLKLVLWTILTLTALLHALARAHVRSRGWQLNRALIALCGLLVGVSAAQTATLFGHGEQQQHARIAWVVLGNLADGMFMLLLMCIASGFCITRATLGDARMLVLVVPAVYLTASLTVDGLLLNGAAGVRRVAAPFGARDCLDLCLRLCPGGTGKAIRAPRAAALRGGRVQAGGGRRSVALAGGCGVAGCG